MGNRKTAMAISDELIIRKIYFIRGHKVMLDKDLAELYGVETKRLNEQVRRNRMRFPAHYMFELTKEEQEILRSHFATLGLEHGKYSKYLPYAFTEHGVLMLSNVLKSESAIGMSIRIIDVFVKMREMLALNKDILLKLEQLEKDVSRHNGDIQTIFKVLKQLLQQPQRPRTPIGFKVGTK